MNTITARRDGAPGAREAGEARRPFARSGPTGGTTSDARLFATMRFILAFAGLVIIGIDPTEPDSRQALTYAAFFLYGAYATGVLLVASRTTWTPDQRVLCAFDIAFASVLVLWTQGTNSIFFYLYFFPILVVSFSHGYRDGLIFTMTSVAAFLLVGSLANPPILQFELNLALIRPLYLLALGYMIARWGGREILFKRRLLLLQEVNDSNPRVELDQIIGINLRRILQFHDADRCIFVVQRTGAESRFVFYSAVRGEPRAGGAHAMTGDSGARLLHFRDTESILYTTRSPYGTAATASCVAVNARGKRECIPASPDLEFVAALLEAPHFVAVPYRQSDGTRGRLFLTSGHSRFTARDVEFLVQFAGALSKVLENVQLLDELVATAAEHERALISRDIHDAAVQPYIGLRLGLEALYREAGPASPLLRRILDLVEMANETVNDLRGFTSGIRSGSRLPSASLGSAVLMQAERHNRFYGLEITTDLDAESARMDGRIAAQVFYVVIEALSNVVKHTGSRRAFVEVKTVPGCVTVRVGNEQTADSGVAPDFMPKSIQSRVESIGGCLDVQTTASGYTVVQATIPA